MKKNIIQKKNPTKLSWPMSAKSDLQNVLFKKKISYQALHITK